MKRQILISLILLNSIWTMKGQAYNNVLKVSFGELSPDYFYVNTKIPFNEQVAPQIQITGYNYSHANKAVKLTISWYVYYNSFYWAQYKSDLGYYNPPRIRLGTYNDAGTLRVRIEIANSGIYWASYFFSATDRLGVPSNYQGWTYDIGSMPSETVNVINVSEYEGINFSNTGNILIGKSTQTNTAYKLDVNGLIRANEIIVNLNGADFVFEKGYKLMPLTELEKFVKEQKHLPEIAPSKEMEKNGTKLGDLNSKLLQKMEEMTLYMIEQNNKIEALKNEIQILKAASK